jgi:hypothetical protein
MKREKYTISEYIRGSIKVLFWGAKKICIIHWYILSNFFIPEKKIWRARDNNSGLRWIFFLWLLKRSWRAKKLIRALLISQKNEYSCEILIKKLKTKKWFRNEKLGFCYFFKAQSFKKKNKIFVNSFDSNWIFVYYLAFPWIWVFNFSLIVVCSNVPNIVILHLHDN